MNRRGLRGRIVRLESKALSHCPISVLDIGKVNKAVETAVADGWDDERVVCFAASVAERLRRGASPVLDIQGDRSTLLEIFVANSAADVEPMGLDDIAGLKSLALGQDWVLPIGGGFVTAKRVG